MMVFVVLLCLAFIPKRIKYLQLTLHVAATPTLFSPPGQPAPNPYFQLLQPGISSLLLSLLISSFMRVRD